MSGELSLDDYLDFKYNQNEWMVGRVIEKENDMIKIRLDGMPIKDNQVYKSSFFLLSRKSS